MGGKGKQKQDRLQFMHLHSQRCWDSLLIPERRIQLFTRFLHREVSAQGERQNHDLRIIQDAESV